MHNASPVTPINNRRYCAKESVDLDILGVIFDFKMTFEKHLRSVSIAASQRFGIWRVFHDRLHRRTCFRGFVLLVLVYWYAVWCSAADTHLKLLDRVVNGACLSTGGVLDCDLAHRRSVAGLCILYNIRCNPMHPLLPVLYVPGRVTRCALVAHRLLMRLLSVKSCTVLQDCYSPLSVSLE